MTEELKQARESLQRTSKREPTGTVTTYGIQPVKNLLVLILQAVTLSLLQWDRNIMVTN